MIKQRITQTTPIERNVSIEGESIEEKVDRIVNNGEPIEDSAPIIWQERREGVLPEYNPRTDRFDLALDAMEAAAKSHIAGRKSWEKTPDKTDSKSSGDESAQATE